MMRLRALEAAIASLPPPDEPIAFWPKPRIHKDGTVSWIHPRYYKSVLNLFEAFEAGHFGFAVGD